MFIVGPGHTFEQFAEAIDAAFARWDLSHLHEFELPDGRKIGYPDDEFAPDLVWLDHAKLKVAREVKPVGVPDYIIRVAVADQDAYEAFYMNKLAELPGLARINSQFTMKMVKRGGSVPI